MVKRIMIPRVKLNEAYGDPREFNRRPRRDGAPMRRFDIEDDDDDTYAERSAEVRQQQRKTSTDTSISTRLSSSCNWLGTYLNEKFSGVHFKVMMGNRAMFEGANSEYMDYRELGESGVYVLPIVDDPMNITYKIDNENTEISGGRVVTDPVVDSTAIFGIVIEAAKKIDPKAPDYVKAIQEIN